MEEETETAAGGLLDKARMEGQHCEKISREGYKSSGWMDGVIRSDNKCEDEKTYNKGDDGDQQLDISR